MEHLSQRDRHLDHCTCSVIKSSISSNISQAMRFATPLRPPNSMTFLPSIHLRLPQPLPPSNQSGQKSNGALACSIIGSGKTLSCRLVAATSHTAQPYRGTSQCLSSFLLACLKELYNGIHHIPLQQWPCNSSPYFRGSVP